jgi:hypothetical protein
MGFYDEVRCDRPLPDGRVVPGGRFQTKMLGRGSAEYTITPQGRLVRHRFREGPPEDGKGALGLPRYSRVHVGDDDTEFHGDIRLSGGDSTGELFEYVARFTHGTLESLVPLAELTEARRAMIAALQDGW